MFAKRCFFIHDKCLVWRKITLSLPLLKLQKIPNFNPMQPTKLKLAKIIMLLSAIYNLFWGALISIYPNIILFGNLPTPFLLIILRCVGMLVGVYGVAYYYCSREPEKFWPLIFVGFLGKALGPFGLAYYIYTGELQPSFLWVNVFNDIIWLVPFGWVIWQAMTGQLSGTKSSEKLTLSILIKKLLLIN